MEHSRIGDGLWVKGEATYRNDEMQIVGSLAACRRGDGPQTPLRNHDRGPHLTSLSLLVKCFELDQRMSPFIIFGNTLQYFPIPPNTSAKKFFFVDFIVQKRNQNLSSRETNSDVLLFLQQRSCIQPSNDPSTTAASKCMHQQASRKPDFFRPQYFFFFFEDSVGALLYSSI